MFRGGPNLLFVSGESEDDSDSDIPHLVADSEDEVIVDEVQICFDAQKLKGKYLEIIVKKI